MKFDLKQYNKQIDFTNIELTPKEAITAFCHQCCAYDSKEVKLCEIKTCPLLQFKNKWYKSPRQKKL